MSRNPYASSSATADPYTNGNGYRVATQAPSSTANDDYDPYGDRYGTPPIPSTSAARDRRAGRTGGYGGFFDSNGTAPSARSVSPQPQPQNDYGRAVDEPGQMRSPRRPAAVEPAGNRRYRTERGDDGGSADTSRSPDYRRGGERLNPSGPSVANNELMASRNRSNGRAVGGDGTRQIEGQ